MLAIYQRLYSDARHGDSLLIDLSLIAFHWRRVEAGEVFRRVQRMYALPARARASSSGAGSSSDLAGLTHAEKVTAVLKEARLAAELCVDDVDLVAELRTKLKDVYDRAANAQAAKHAADVASTAAGAHSSRVIPNMPKPTAKGRGNNSRHLNAGQEPAAKRPRTKK